MFTMDMNKLSIMIYLFIIDNFSLITGNENDRSLSALMNCFLISSNGSASPL